MDAEYYKIDEISCGIVNKAKEGGHRICSIGTTTMRAMESSYTAQKLLKPSEGWTNHFIHPPIISISRTPWLPIFTAKNKPPDHGLCLCRLRPDDGSI